MAEYIGSILIPNPSTEGVFPLTLEYGMVTTTEPKVAVHQFGHGDVRVEQRFYQGPGQRRFSLKWGRLTNAKKTQLVEFFEDRKGSYQPFTLNVGQPDGSTLSYTVQFAEPSLALDQVSACQWSGGLELIEVPSTTPSYSISSTQNRFPSEGLQSALLGQVQEIVPLVKIGADIYVSDRRIIVGGITYQPRLLDFDGISQSLDGAADQAGFTLGNADRVFTELVNSSDLDRAPIELSLFHVASTTKLDLWKGHVSEFKLSANDGLFDLHLPYPSRKITRQDGFVVGDQPVNVGGKGGISKITASNVSNDTAYGKALKDIYVSDWSHPVPVECEIIAGRDESELFAALGVIGRGPISSFGDGHTLDGQPHHGPGNMGLRRSFGGNYIDGSEVVLDMSPDAWSNSFSLDAVGAQLVPTNLPGVAFMQIRRTDEKGVQVENANFTQHKMTAYVAGGLGCWTWVAEGVRLHSPGCTNPAWIALNMLLRAKGKWSASVADQESLFEVQAAIDAAAICDSMVSRVIGIDEEKQYTFTGTIGEERPLKDWMQEVLSACLGYSTFSFGKLKIGTRINSSAVEAFTVGNIIHNSLALSALKPKFNDLTVSYADVDYNYAANALNLKDNDHLTRIGDTLKSNANLLGVTTKSQAARICTTRLREELGGLGLTEILKARQISFKTTALALNTEPGMVCSMTHPDMPGGTGEFRVVGWKLNKDLSIDIQGRTTTDAMYDLVQQAEAPDVA